MDDNVPAAAHRLPPRVGLAFHALQHFSAVQAGEAVPYDGGVHVTEGRPLEIEERQAWAAACACLTQYLQGKLERTPWDGPPPHGVVWLEDCPQCDGAGCLAGDADVRCEGCGGRGRIAIKKVT